MLYNLKDEFSRKRFAARVRFLWEKGALVELTDATRRTVRQNSYLHICIGTIAVETGNSPEVVKQQIYKEQVNPDIFITEKDDPVLGRIKIIRSSSSLNKEEMSLSIDRLRKFASEHGIYIPSPDEEELMAIAEQEIANAQKYF